MTVFPIVPDFERYPEYGRDLDCTFGEIGLAGHWIKILLHHMFLYKARLRPAGSSSRSDHDDPSAPTPARPHRPSSSPRRSPPGSPSSCARSCPGSLRFAFINLKMLRIIRRSHAGH